MVILLLVYLGGVLSLISPCILPVIPFVFAKGHQPWARSGLPLLIGMAVTFAGVATLTTLAGGWVIEANQYGRAIALAVMAMFGLALVSDRLAGIVARPAVALGARLSTSSDAVRARSAVSSSLLLGMATGFLWTPCAGPILGLVLAAAALKGASVGTTILLLAFAAGAASALGVVLFAGSRLVGALGRTRSARRWIHRGLGAAVLASVAAVATGADIDILSNLPTFDTAPIEQALIRQFGVPTRATSHDAAEPRASAQDETDAAGPDRDLIRSGLIVSAAFAPSAAAPGEGALQQVSADGLASEGGLPSLSGATEWINSQPLSAGSLRGRVVLVNIWTYACINCRHVLPHIKAWAAKYHDAGLVVIGVHTPELAFERDTSNVRRAVNSYGITYPVAVDTHSAIWNSFNNEFWPSNYFADRNGRIRYHHFGEGDYQHQEQVIQQLLRDAGASNVPGGYASVEDDLDTDRAVEEARR